MPTNPYLPSSVGSAQLGTKTNPYRTTASLPGENQFAGLTQSWQQNMGQLQSLMSNRQQALSTPTVAQKATGPSSVTGAISGYGGSYPINQISGYGGGRSGLPGGAGYVPTLSTSIRQGVGGLAGILGSGVESSLSNLITQRGIANEGPLPGGGGGNTGEDPSLLTGYSQLTGVPVKDIQASLDPNWYGWKQLYPQATTTTTPAGGGGGGGGGGGAGLTPSMAIGLGVNPANYGTPWAVAPGTGRSDIQSQIDALSGQGVDIQDPRMKLLAQQREYGAIQPSGGGVVSPGYNPAANKSSWDAGVARGLYNPQSALGSGYYG